MTESFEIKNRDKRTKARIGIIHTKKGALETPFFMPVATKTAVKYISTDDLNAMGAKVCISNALILSSRPGVKVIKKFGGIGKFMNFSGANVTDSGGFQMYSKHIYQSSDDSGVRFRDPIDGKHIFMTPEKNMDIQLAIGSEIAMCLDAMPLYENSREEIIESARKTLLWAERCKKHHDLLQKDIPKEKRQLLWGITQGGIYKDLREKATKEMVALNFDGYSIGGMGMGETFNEEMKIVKLQKEIFPENKPIYLMGIGNPVEILQAVSYGVDMFDSRFPTQNARHGTLFTSHGKLKILNECYKEDKKPVDDNCDCFVCKNHSRAYLRHMLLHEDSVGKRLATFHNLYYLQNLMKQTKEHIKSGTFKKFLGDVKKAYKRDVGC